MTPRKQGGGGASPSLKDAVAELAPRKNTLGELDLKLLESLKTVEHKLREHLPTRVSVTIESNSDVGVEWAEVLTFGKWDGKWQFLLENGETNDPEGWKTQPLVTASREKRVTAFTGGHIEKLVRAAVSQLDAQITERENALAIASSVIDALEVDDDHPF